jgi:hypothetical protein
MISIAMFFAKALTSPPQKKLTDPTRMLARLPFCLVTCEAAKVETRAAKYREEVKRVRT